METPDEIIKNMNEMKNGQSVVIQGRGGWMIKLIKTPKGFDLVHFNPIGDDENQQKFFRYSTTGNPYGAGMIEQEPTLGVTCRSCGVNIDGLIVGAIVMKESRVIVDAIVMKESKVSDRYSWSNLVFKQKKSFRITMGGELIVDGRSKGYLHAVFVADKNRVKGFVGVFAPEKSKGKVRVLEMENLLLKYLE